MSASATQAGPVHARPALRAVQVWLDQGDRERAIVEARRALAAGEAEHPLLLQLRANGAVADGRSGDALVDLERAHGLAPDDVGVLTELGLCLGRLGRFADAIARFQAALTIAPAFIPARFGEGLAFERLGRPAQASACFRHVLEYDPAHVGAAARGARLAVNRGAWDEARSLAAQALRNAPDDPDARRARIEADLGQDRVAEAEADARLWVERTAALSTPRARALTLLGDALDRQGRFPEAFDAYVQSADTQRRGAPAAGPPGRASAHLDALGAAFASQTADPDPGPGPGPGPTSTVAPRCDPPVDPIFLIGFMRSGTTLLEQALSAHPGLAVLEEQEALAEPTQAFLHGGAQGLRDLGRLDRSGVERYRAAYWSAVGRAGVQPQGRRLLDKMPLNGAKLPVIARLFPNAQVVFAVRDPRDVVLSCFRRSLRPNSFSQEMLTLTGAAQLYDRYMRLFQAYARASPLDLIWHRHEAFVADAAPYLAKLVARLGLPALEAPLDLGTRLRAGAVVSQSGAQVAQGIDSRGVGHWRNYRQQLTPVASTLAPWVRALGYPDD